MTVIQRDVVVYYYDPIKAPLLRDAVLPALRHLQPGIEAHLERGWLHGPHVRLRLAGERHTLIDASAQLARGIARHLVDHRSRVRMSPDELSALATAAGRAELVPPPYEPFIDDNTVRVEEPDPAAAARVSGGPATRAVRAALLRAGVPAVEATVADVGRRADTTQARVRAAVIALAAHAAAGRWGLHSNYISYLSHLELYLHHADPDGTLRARHHAIWRRTADRVTDLVAGSVDANTSDPLAAAWQRWGATARDLAAAAHDRGELRSASPRDTLRRLAAFDDPTPLMAMHASTDSSEFHQLVQGFQRDADAQRGFDIERFCTNMLYLLLAVTDLTPAERYLAAALVTEAAQRLSGRTWREFVEEVLRSQAAAAATPR
ncbi:lantibiotic dehydratase C-terminal domain-containing protein [Rugosimonospora africana]|nr:lantibiotic dehydratase C-terminal domain-containing protein [Rugosimonospora africana]